MDAFERHFRKQEAQDEDEAKQIADRILGIMRKQKFLQDRASPAVQPVEFSLTEDQEYITPIIVEVMTDQMPAAFLSKMNELDDDIEDEDEWMAAFEEFWAGHVLAMTFMVMTIVNRMTGVDKDAPED